ncbi:MAG: TonB-dependent receptor [Sphingomonas sp.]|nr:TonB-dependent receptor [Sphingomonas sp.]
MRNALLLGAATAALLPAMVHAQTVPTDALALSANSAARSGDIIVTATPFDLNADETASIAAKVDRQQILEQGGANLADALKNVPGISSTSFAQGASRPIIRGMDASRVRMLEDGLSTSDVSDIGPDHGVPVDPLSAQSIEVVRGAASLRYGSQAIGGVVNAINNRVPMSLPDQPLSGTISGGYDSVSDTGEGSVMGDGRAGNIAVHVDGFYRHADDYDTPLGTQANSFFHGFGQSVGASYFFGNDSKSHIGASIQRYDAQYGIPSDDTYIDMRQTKVLTRSSFDLGSGFFKKFTFDGSYSKYAHDEDEPGGDVVTTFRNKEYDGHGELLLAPLGPVKNIAIGSEVTRREFSAVGEDSSYLFPTLTTSEAGYIVTDSPLTDSLRLQVSGRVEHVRETGTPASDIATVRDFTPLSGAIGALYDVGGAGIVKLGLTFSSTGRAPAITELYARGGHDGPDTFETGDPNLKIERSNSLEASLRVNAGPFRFEGSAYSSWFHNYIYGQLTGRMCDDDGVCAVGGDGDLKELNYRQQGAHFRGLEAKASYAVMDDGNRRLEVNALGDYVRATFDDGSNVPRIPPYRYGGGLSWSSKPFDADVQFIHYARQNKYGAFDFATPSYNDLSASVTVHPFTENRNIALSVVGQNLTDDVQRNAAALNRADVVQPGRNIRAVLKIGF